MYYEYKLKNGDTLSTLIHKMFGVAPSSSRYPKVMAHLLALNPQISNPDQIRAGTLLRLAELPAQSQQPFIAQMRPSRRPLRQSPIARLKKPIKDSFPSFISESVSTANWQDYWLAASLAENSNYLTIPGSVALGASANLLNQGNVNLIHQVDDLYAQYKKGEITKGQYDGRRKKALDLLKQRIGPVEKLLFGKKTTSQSLRITRAGGVPSTENIRRQAAKIKAIGRYSQHGGLVLGVVGLTASCIQIANTDDIKEKNEIFVETLVSTTMGAGLGYVVGLFLISSPVGWGTALVLATGTTVASYGLGKLVRLGYTVTGHR
ncbi:hypothetical protein MNBD_GAMMA04-1068, partial [hydrothermal vent metagenome]